MEKDERIATLSFLVGYPRLRCSTNWALMLHSLSDSRSYYHLDKVLRRGHIPPSRCQMPLHLIRSPPGRSSLPLPLNSVVRPDLLISTTIYDLFNIHPVHIVTEFPSPSSAGEACNTSPFSERPYMKNPDVIDPTHRCNVCCP